MRTVFKVKHIISALGLLAVCHSSWGADLQLNGRGIANKFQLDYFLAELYIDQPSTSAEMLASKKNMRMELSIAVEEWSKRQFTQHWNQAIFINNSAEDRRKYSEEISEWLSSIKGPLKKGDHLVFKKSKDRLTFSVNGVEIYENIDSGLASIFLNTWIGSRPPSSEFRASILGVDNLPEDRYSQTAMLKPDLTRIKEIRGWLPEKKSSKPDPVDPPQPDSPATKPTTIDQVPEITLAETAKTSETMDASISEAYLAWFAGVPLQEFDETAANDAEGSLFQNAEGSLQRNAEGSLQKDAEGSSPKIAEGSLKEDAEGSPTVSDEEDEDTALLKVYRSNILTLTYQNLIYPNSAIDRGQEGKILMKLTLDRRGKVRNMEYDQKSRHRTLNKAAARAVEQASPYPEPPRKLKGKEIVVTVPIVFSLSG